MSCIISSTLLVVVCKIFDCDDERGLSSTLEVEKNRDLFQSRAESYTGVISSAFSKKEMLKNDQRAFCSTGVLAPPNTLIGVLPN